MPKDFHMCTWHQDILGPMINFVAVSLVMSWTPRCSGYDHYRVSRTCHEALSLWGACANSWLLLLNHHYLSTLVRTNRAQHELMPFPWWKPLGQREHSISSTMGGTVGTEGCAAPAKDIRTSSSSSSEIRSETASSSSPNSISLTLARAEALTSAAHHQLAYQPPAGSLGRGGHTMRTHGRAFDDGSGMFQLRATRELPHKSFVSIF